MNYNEYKKTKKEIDKIGRNDIILKLIEDITYENKQLKAELELYKDNHEYLNNKIGKAIECIKKRNTTKSKKERFMSGETTLEKVLKILGGKE